MTFDSLKPVQTRDGRTARIICADRKHGLPIIALVDEDESVERFRADGTYYEQSSPSSPDDLINIPEKRWAVLHYEIVLDRHYVEIFHDEDKAKAWARKNSHSFACLEYTEGQGL